MTDDHPVRRVDSNTPHTARIWDAQLSGKDNFEVDRRAAKDLNEACRAVGAPDGRDVARSNRAFIGRAVRYLAEAGIDQFLDLGSGFPTQGNVHEIAQGVNPAARTVYVDYDAMVAAHGRALLADNDRTIVIEADVRDPDALLSMQKFSEHLDLNRPVAVLMVALLHLFRDGEEPARIVARFRDALPPGSYLVITHVTGDKRAAAAEAVASLFESLGVSTPLVPREHQQILGYFDGFDLVEPGLVFVEDWRPDPGDDPRSRAGTEWFYAGMGLATPKTQPSAGAAQASTGTGDSSSQLPSGGDRPGLSEQASDRADQRADDVREPSDPGGNRP